MKWELPSRQYGQSLIFIFLLLLSSSAVAVQQAGQGAVKERTKTDTNREVIRTYGEIYIEEKNYELAEKTLTQYLVSDSQDADLWNLLGISQLAQKKYIQACYAFKHSSEIYPVGSDDQANALYNLADCLNQGEKQRESMQVLKSMNFHSEGVRGLAESVLAQMQKKNIKPGQALPHFTLVKPAPHLKVSGALAVGYDTNVLLIDDLTASTGGVSGQGSMFTTPALQVGYWGNIFDQRFDTRLLTSFTNYLDKSEKSYNMLYERVDFLVGSSSLRAGLIQEMTFLNRDPFQMYFLNGGFTIQKKNRTSDTSEWFFELPMKYKYYYMDRDAPADNVRTGPEVAAKAQYMRILDEDTRFSSQLALSNAFTRGKNYRLAEANLPTTFMVSLPPFKRWGVTNLFGVEFDYQYYWQSDQGRRDGSVKGSAGFMRDIVKNMRGALEYAFQKNYSTVESARYHKHLITLTLSYDLL